jgi:LPXTG-motif cell wall-anchored protein
VTLDVIARPVPAVVSEAVPVFPRATDRSLPALPMTGASVEPAIAIGVVLLVIGIGIIVFTRMRRRTRSS